MKRVLGFVGACALGAAGCQAPEGLEDPEGEAFLLDEKADVAGIREGSPEACGILGVASTASEAVLRTEVGLTTRAARAVVAYRLGPDGAPGTADDQIFDGLAELDRVSWIGKQSFQRFRSYAAAKGAACTTADLQLLSFSDWHGQIDPLAVPMVGNVGGAAALRAAFRADRQANPRTLTFTAGDAFGATPPLASFFEEAPAVLALNAMGIDGDGLGNHNFDRGLDHLARMIGLARYPFLSANLKNVDENLRCDAKPGGRCVQPYQIFPLGGVRVAVIGLTNPDAAALVKPGNMGTIEVRSPVAAALEARARAAAEGAQVFVVLVHMGATGLEGGTTPVGPLIDLAKQLSGFDLVLGDHTNVPVDMEINGARVIENKSSGGTYARLQLRYDFAAGKATLVDHALVTPKADGLPADPELEALLAPYRADLAKAFDGQVATTSGVFERGNNVERLREVPLGNLVADSMRARYGTQLAFVNGGGLRAPIPSSYTPANQALKRPGMGFAGGPPFDVVVGDVYAVLPFGNAVATRTVTGAQLWRMMEHGVEALPNANGWFPQVSGFKVVFDSSRPAGGRVKALTLDDGTPIGADETRYTLATSDFLDAGGDGYTMLAGSTESVSREKMAEVLVDHLRARGSLEPKVEGRIVDQP